MTRRKFLKFAALGVLSLAGGTGAWVGTQDYLDAVKLAVRKRLSWLKINEASLEKFAQDFTSRFPKSRGRVFLIHSMRLLTSALPFKTSLNARLAEHEDYVLAYFLQGSDFLINGADESREVRYLVWPDGRESPCNPTGYVMREHLGSFSALN